jgi:protein-tyrosine phosphatase
MERALQHELDQSWGAGAIQVRSAGTGALVGHPVEDEAASLLAAQGYSAKGFEARQLTAALVADSHLVLTATRAHRGTVASLHPRALRYVFSFREFADLLSGVADDALDGQGEQPAEHVARVVALAASQRGTRTPLSDADADIVDPYRRSREVFDQMSRQIMGSLPDVLRALRKS